MSVRRVAHGNARPRRPYLQRNTCDRNDRAIPLDLLGYAWHKPFSELGIARLRPICRNFYPLSSPIVGQQILVLTSGAVLAGHRRMRLIWLPIIALACVGMVFLFRSGLRAHAENYSDAIEKVHSNKEAKGDRLDLLYRPPRRQPTVPVQPVLAPQELAVQPILAQRPPAKPELSKPTETVSWHWRQGAKTITKTSSSGEKSQLSRAKAR
jgi:hypothetical protein